MRTVLQCRDGYVVLLHRPAKLSFKPDEENILKTVIDISQPATKYGDLFCPPYSFVRSVTMDKWKDIELEKMKAGGNGKFRLFLELQGDYDPTWTLQEKYNSKAAALFRDKVWNTDLMVSN